MDNVVEEHEAKRLIEMGTAQGYERSTEISPEVNWNQRVSLSRTSTNTWCRNGCYSDELAQTVIHRISNLTEIDERNSEYLQLLRYEPGQFYTRHYDYIPFHQKRQQGKWLTH
jgi:prolyl 4-hydroxylase